MNVFVNASVYACLTDAKWSIIVLKPVSSEEEHEAGSDISGNNKTSTELDEISRGFKSYRFKSFNCLMGRFKSLNNGHMLYAGI